MILPCYSINHITEETLLRIKSAELTTGKQEGKEQHEMAPSVDV